MATCPKCGGRMIGDGANQSCGDCAQRLWGPIFLRRSLEESSRYQERQRTVRVVFWTAVQAAVLAAACLALTVDSPGWRWAAAGVLLANGSGWVAWAALHKRGEAPAQAAPEPATPEALALRRFGLIALIILAVGLL